MNTIFIGGSRHVSRLPAEVRQRLDNVIGSRHRVIVGDANGADKAVQKYLHEVAYDNVTVFCSGGSPRNNLGDWRTQKVEPPKGTKGFQFYAAKDREMAREADFGLMIWDSKSPGTILNVLRLVRHGKIAVLFSVPDKRVVNFKTQMDWNDFLSHCNEEFRRDLRERATAGEWGLTEQQSLLEAAEERLPTSSEKELEFSFNAALAAADPNAAVDALGGLARARGMSRIAKDSGLSRESLYRALSHNGNPEFATVLRVLSSMGLRLNAAHMKGDADLGSGS